MCKSMSQPAPKRRLRSIASWFSQHLGAILHVIFLTFVYACFIIVILNSSNVYFDYKSFARDVLKAHNITTCPTICSFNLTSQRHDLRAVIVVDNPSGTLVLLRLYTTQHKEAWVATSRTTQINVTFDGGLYVEAYPLYPLSDAAPRSAYLPSSGNLTIRATPPAIGGTIQPLQAIISVVVGLLAALGILKHVTKTPAENVMGSASSINQMTCIIACIPILSLPFTALLISLLNLLLGLSLSLDSTYATLISLIFLNPIVLYFLKSYAVVIKEKRSVKVSLLHLYDLAVLIWVLLWLIDPIPTIIKPEFISAVLFSIPLFLIPLLLGGLLRLVSLIIKIIGLKTQFFLLSIIPFILNEELAARAEFCQMAVGKPTRVRVYLEGGRSIEGFVVECDMDKIAVYDHRNYSTRVFSWGDVQQIERL